MSLFATPDFGASACIYGFLLIVWAAVLVLVLVGFGWGAKLLRSESPKIKMRGILILLVSVLVPLTCCLAPPHTVRVLYGNYPIGSYPNNKIHKGMTADDVTEVLGTPHERFTQGGGEQWYYWIDSFGIGYFGVRFGPDGRVIGTHGN